MKAAFLIGGVKSGSGKTLVTLGLMAALCKRFHSVQPFKCGPDYIDPTLHQLVTGKPSSNLDIKMCGENFCRQTFEEKLLPADIGVIEGVMGLFDGGDGSSASLAKSLNIPVILVIDVRSAAESIAAVLHGFETYDAGLNIAGVIFNFIGSARHKALIENEVKKRCKTRILGFLPREEHFSIPSRHLGLHMGEELKQQLNQDKIAQLIETYIDIDMLLQLCECNTKKAKVDAKPVLPPQYKSVRLAVARDEAFCFYYQDNLDMLTRAGIEICYFSPLHDSTLPENIQGIYLGGGYPELYAKHLSANKLLIEQLRRFSRNGGFIYGECGGYMYLCNRIVDKEGRGYPMVGLFQASIRMDKKLRKLGYREIQLCSTCLLGEKGEVLYGHEFHYSDEDPDASQFPPLFEDANEVHGAINGNCIGSYVHLHFGRTPELAEQIYKNLVKERAGC